MDFSDAQIDRYARHLILPEIDEAGQAKLVDAKIAVIGAGGIGAPALMYLASSGIGTLVIIDDDVVELSNLQRQVIHPTTNVGVSKAASAKEQIKALNPEVVVETKQVRLTNGNASDLIRGADLVVDGSDSYETRSAVNQACVNLAVPLVSASVARFDGQLLVTRGKPCYQCCFPQSPGATQSCAEVGVFAPLAGIMGCLAAGEAIKTLIGLNEMSGRLLLVDGKSLRFDSFQFGATQECAVCA